MVLVLPVVFSYISTFLVWILKIASEFFRNSSRIMKWLFEIRSKGHETWAKRTRLLRCKFKNYHYFPMGILEEFLKNSVAIFEIPFVNIQLCELQRVCAMLPSQVVSLHMGRPISYHLSMSKRASFARASCMHFYSVHRWRWKCKFFSSPLNWKIKHFKQNEKGTHMCKLICLIQNLQKCVNGGTILFKQIEIQIIF